jgi:glucosamine-6-phosphate deaminase
VDEHDGIARLVASRIATLIRERQASGQRAVLGLATGSTPIGVYRELIRMHRENGLSFANVVTFNLDEYYPMAKDSIHAYHRYMWENLFAHVDVDPANVHLPPGDLPREQLDEACLRYELEIERAGGIDFQLLGIGKTGTSASTSRARASRAARASSTSTTSRASTPPPTSSARRTCRARR